MATNILERNKRRVTVWLCGKLCECTYCTHCLAVYSRLLQQVLSLSWLFSLCVWELRASMARLASSFSALTHLGLTWGPHSDTTEMTFPHHSTSLTAEANGNEGPHLDGVTLVNSFIKDKSALSLFKVCHKQQTSISFEDIKITSVQFYENISALHSTIKWQVITNCEILIFIITECS